MARLARVVGAGLPHHVTRRGNRRQQRFFCDEDYQQYVDLMAQFCKAEQIAIWAQLRPPDRDSTDNGGPTAGNRRGASALHQDGQLEGTLAGPPLARKARLVRSRCGRTVTQYRSHCVVSCYDEMLTSFPCDLGGRRRRRGFAGSALVLGFSGWNRIGQETKNQA